LESARTAAGTIGENAAAAAFTTKFIGDREDTFSAKTKDKYAG
jgi:hypothetical protein